MVASVGNGGIILSVSSFESSAVESPVSAASLARVIRLCVRNERSLSPIVYGSSNHWAYETFLVMANFLSGNLCPQ